MNADSIAHDLLMVLSQIEHALRSHGFGEQAEDIRVLIEAGEGVVALEQICSHIEELGFPIQPHTYELIASVGIRMKMDAETWEHLRAQVRQDEAQTEGRT